MNSIFLDANLQEKGRKTERMLERKTSGNSRREEDIILCKGEIFVFLYLIGIAYTYLYTLRNCSHKTERYSIIYNRTNCQHYIKKVPIVEKTKNRNLTNRN